MYAKNDGRRRRAFTLIETLVVILIIAILAGLLIPAVLYTRESSRRISCSNNLKQLGIALNSYESVHAVYPQGINGKFSSGQMMLLPFLHQINLYNSINFNTPRMDVAFANKGANETAGRTVLAALFCPSDPDFMKGPSTSYALNGGFGYQKKDFVGTFFTTASTKYRYLTSADISDGLSRTAAMAEWRIGQIGSSDDVSVVFRIVDGSPDHYSQFVQTCKAANRENAEFGAWKKDTHWAYGVGGSTIMNFNLPPNSNSCWSNFAMDFGIWSASSYHFRGVNVLFFDSHVTFTDNDVAIKVWNSISTRASGDEL